MLPHCGREKDSGHQLLWESESSAYVAGTTAGGMTPLAVGGQGGGDVCGWRAQCIPEGSQTSCTDANLRCQSPWQRRRREREAREWSQQDHRGTI